MNAIAAGLRTARIVHAGFVVAALLYILLIFRIQPPAREVSSIMVYALAFEAVVVVCLGVLFGRRRVRACEEKLRANSSDLSPLGPWRVGIVLSFVFAECIVLFGFLLKFMAADWKIAGPFFAFGILLMLLWTLRLEVPALNQ